MRRAFSWVVVRVAWHLTGATVVLDWDQGDFGLADKRPRCGFYAALCAFSRLVQELISIAAATQ